MRTFAEIEKELSLKRFLASELGTLYFVPQAAKGPKLMVRRFDGAAPPAMASPYAEIVRAAQAWLDKRPSLAALVRVEQPVELGADFIARPFHVYLVRTSSYFEEDPPELPEEFDHMQEAFCEEVGGSDDSRDAIVERVLSRSIMEPSGKTYPGSPEDDPSGTQFVIVDPKLTLADLEEWVALRRPVAK